MSEKPFWEGKTCEEMAGLPVKAVFKNGVTITGQLSRFGDIPISTEGMNSPISISSNTLNFRPHREISSVELLDSLEYERIDNIEDVREAQVHVSYRNAGKTQNAVDAHEGVDTRRFHPSLECDVQRRPEIQADSRESGRQTMSTLDILGNTSEQADSIRLMLKVRGMKDGRFIDADPLIILKADNHQGSDRWDVYVSKTVYPTAESYGTLAGILRMLANDVEIMAHEKEMGGRQ